MHLPKYNEERSKSTIGVTKNGSAPFSSKKRRHSRCINRVRFSNVVTVREVPSHREYTLDERAAVWYTRFEYLYFKVSETHPKLSILLLKQQMASRFIRTTKIYHISSHQQLWHACYASTADKWW